jgi:hypothetical protein
LIKDYNEEKSKIVLDNSILKWNLEYDEDFSSENKFNLFWKGELLKNNIQIDIIINEQKISLKNNNGKFILIQ